MVSGDNYEPQWSSRVVIGCADMNNLRFRPLVVTSDLSIEFRLPGQCTDIHMRYLCVCVCVCVCVGTC